MSIQRASLMMPCSRLEDLPRGLVGPAAAEMLSAWTTLWHPGLIATTGGLPGWHSTDDPPEPEKLEGELILIPPVSRERLPADWRGRMQATCPRNPPLVISHVSRSQTVQEALAAAAIPADLVAADVAADFLALGYAHLQIELMTRSMHYTTVLDAESFRAAVIEAARAAVKGESERAHQELVAAFDMLADARNHFYAVDFFLVDVTLLAPSTLGDSLRAKLRTGPPTNLLVRGDLMNILAEQEPATLADVRASLLSKNACLVSGPFAGSAIESRAPEGILAELFAGYQACQRVLDHQPTIYGQFGATYSPLMPEILTGLGFRGALVSSFDGGRPERPAQPKARWGARDGASIEILSTTPLDVADPVTWMTLGELIGDTLMRDHVATILLAGWPGQACEYYEDLRRIARFGPALGKFVTLDDYFHVADGMNDWAPFHPLQYPPPPSLLSAADPLSSRVGAYRQQVVRAFDQLVGGLSALAHLAAGVDRHAGALAHAVVLNPWNTASVRFLGFEPNLRDDELNAPSEVGVVPDVPGLGYAVADRQVPAAPVPLAAGRTLRNELVEIVVSEATGGIQSFRTHRDRNTRVSQRLVMHDGRLPQEPLPATIEASKAKPAVQMIAERVEITRNDGTAGEIMSRGTLTDASDNLLARFVQTMRLARGLPVVFIDVALDAELKPDGELWNSYFASRMAWREEAVTVRAGVDWSARETTRRRIESPEWIEMEDITGRMTCFAFGLPYHRLASDTWLDTLLLTAGETRNRRQFAIGLNCQYPSQTSLALLTAGRPAAVSLPIRPPSPTGWFLHVDAKNVIVTHLELLPAPANGVRLRLLETEGRGVGARVSAFRPFATARRTDFRGEPVESLSIVEGRAELEIGPNRWLQIEAEW